MDPETQACEAGRLCFPAAHVASLPLRQSMGSSTPICRLASQAELVATTDFTVLVSGETGAGKDLVAMAIHSLSPRSSGPFVAVDTGSISPTLIESELFGHEKGSFTGANGQHEGKLETAAKGTLFLDEIANLPLAIQPKLLRILQEKEICAVGGNHPHKVDLRVIAATNEPLLQLVQSGKFRRDLYYRLNEFSIKVPPLRERPEDILYLANRFIEMTNLELKKRVVGLSQGALGRLLRYPWPGNVRELRNVVRSAVLLAETAIEVHHLAVLDEPAAAAACPEPCWDFEPGMPLKETVQRVVVQVERDILKRVLLETQGNKAQAARILRIDYKTMHKKVREYGVPVPMTGATSKGGESSDPQPGESAGQDGTRGDEARGALPASRRRRRGENQYAARRGRRLAATARKRQCLELPHSREAAPGEAGSGPDRRDHPPAPGVRHAGAAPE
jgi:two-component system nitrogen regulation response regulator GlnG